MSIKNTTGAERASTITRLRGWATSHRRAAVAIAGGAVAVIITAAVGVPAAASTIAHAQADSAYQSARTRAVVQYRSDVAAQKRFATALAGITDLRKQITEIHDQAAAGHFLPDSQLKVIAAELSQLKMYAGFKPGKPVVDPDPRGRPTSTTAQLEQETARLNDMVREQANSATTTSRGGPGIVVQTASANKMLDQVVVGLAKSEGIAAVPALDADAATVITALNKAGQGEKDALTAAAVAAKTGVKGGKDPAPLLLAYLAKAKAVNASHVATVAAEAAAAAAAAQAAAQAAANAGQSTYTDPTTGQTKSTPRSSSGGSRGGSSTGGGGGSSGGGGSASSGGGSSSGGGTSSGGGGGYTPPAVDHTPHVIANGAYTPGCNGVQMYSQTTSSGGEIVINVGYPYKYSTFSTSDGWGLTVYGCA